MPMVQPPTSKPIAGQKRKRGQGTPVVKSKAKKNHEESKRLQDLEKRVADLVEDPMPSKIATILIFMSGGISYFSSICGYADFRTDKARYVDPISLLSILSSSLGLKKAYF